MKAFNVHEAKSQLSRLLVMVERGESVTIMRGGKPVADLVLHRRPPARRKLGFLAPLQLPDGWDAPMSDKQASRFLRGKDW